MAFRCAQLWVAVSLCFLASGLKAEHGELEICNLKCVDVEETDKICNGALCSGDSEDRESLCSGECIGAIINLVQETDSCRSDADSDSFPNAIDVLQEVVTEECSNFMEANGSESAHELDDITLAMLDAGV